ncbi:hypothetical protein H0H92_011615 [Tricholoma furcatifolium]|nr:hypothetical protein H0H92_011615 [Tricholoma furcatifolium]
MWSTDNKIDEHTAASVKRRDPSLSKLAWTYNTLLKKLLHLIDQGRAPPGAVVPQKIETKGLFALDVDDAIWQDAGLTGDASTTPPPWLADELVRDGIRALLESDRCVEEDMRLKHEFCSMRLWLHEEWDIVNAAIEKAETDGVLYFLNLRRTKLLQYCALWQDTTSNIYSHEPEVSSTWGPSKEEVDDMRLIQRTESVVMESDDEGEDFDDNNGALFDTLEAVDLADAFRTHYEEEYIVD